MTDFNALFASTRTIAVVGCSARTERTSHRIATYLKNNGFRIIPVNPNYDTVLGQTCYPSLLDIPDETEIDILNIFRNPRYTADMVEDAVRRSAQTGRHPVIWTQIGVSSNEAREKARAADLPYIKNRCIMVEHSRRTSVED
jgi:predicted CoA-binding protein